ncbi:MAG: hypothetical protein Tsb004_31430 [Allomuricauda sp.]
MEDISFDHHVLLAENFELLADWYKHVFGFEVLVHEHTPRNYMELGIKNSCKLKIIPFLEYPEYPTSPTTNALLYQFEVHNLAELVSTIQQNQGTVIKGPTKMASMYYAIAKDIEDNEIWLIQRKEPMAQD